MDEILEFGFGLSLSLDDIRAVLGLPDTVAPGEVLGCTMLDNHEAFIDETLDPTEHPEQEGRYHFTIAHEIGHVLLHEPPLHHDAAQVSLFGEPLSSSVLCRRSGDHDPVGYQANGFAACLLMPRDMVIQAWKKHFGSLSPQRCRPPELAALRMGGIRVSDDESITRVFNDKAAYFARLFHASVEAMRIRLEQLGLLVRQTSLF